ncbi:MAG: o-succinylbenzoate synthase [Bacteroidetes bacterium]|nr:o-succinylbenzoate synthase [Bacteroidota bacterium]MCB9226801.1 o-succinylbenzoate synthase [Chitinophagales bacterium]
MLTASFEKYVLQFKSPSGTSRGILRTKDTYFITLNNGKNTAIGEAALFRGLSADDVPNYEEKLATVCNEIAFYKDNYHETLKQFPSIVFGLEQAFLKLKNKADFCFDNDFTVGKKGIPINGLIWMGTETFMQKQIEDKLKQGFHCIKMKIGAIGFDKEIALLKNLREKFSAKKLELRVDANGAFAPNEAMEKLQELAQLQLHSIEQPIKQGQQNEMEKLCASTPLPIALDEELIGIFELKEKQALLDKIKPQYIILKPALVGGFISCDEWIKLAEERNIGWWITSALESNIGLDAIAQYTASKSTSMYQGLGTGQLFTNNTPSTLSIIDARLWRLI